MTECNFPHTNSQSLGAGDVEVMYNVREGLIDLAQQSTAANCCFNNLKRNDFKFQYGSDNVGTYSVNTLANGGNLGASMMTNDTLTVHPATSFCVTCASNCAGGVNCYGTKCCELLFKATCCNVCLYSCICGSSAATCSYSVCNVSNSASCCIAFQSYDNIYVTYQLIATANVCNSASASLCMFGLSKSVGIGGVGCTGTITCCGIIHLKKIGGNCYCYNDNFVTCGVIADITAYCICNISSAGGRCNNTGEATVQYTIVTGATPTEKTTCSTSIPNNYCARNIYVGGEKTGTGTVVYNVLDGANNCVLASAIPFNTGTCLCGSKCAQCLIVQIKQCSNALSIIKNWGYVIDK